MTKGEPTIKGIFVNSHINAVREAKGEKGVSELARRFGKAILFKNWDDVSVSDEVKLIEHALDVIHEDGVPPEKRAFEAGRLHFQDFSTTPLARMLLSTIRAPKRIFMNAKYIAEHVFQGITYSSTDMGPKSVKITMEGGIYPLDHFRGLFWEWLLYWGYDPRVDAVQVGPMRYEYTLDWSKRKPKRPNIS